MNIGATRPALPICREVVYLSLLCILDMLTSAFLFHHGMAVELNPVLRPYAEAGVASFVTAKSLSFVPTMIFMEWYRRSRADVALPLLRFGLAAYVAIYLGGTFLQQLR